MKDALVGSGVESEIAGVVWRGGTDGLSNSVIIVFVAEGSWNQRRPTGSPIHVVTRDDAKRPKKIGGGAKFRRMLWKKLLADLGRDLGVRLAYTGRAGPP